MKILSSLCLFALAGAHLIAQPSSEAPRQFSLGIVETRTGEAISSSARQAGQANSLQRVTQSLDQQLLPAFHGVRRFEIKARGDLNRLLEESSATGQSFAIPGVDFIVVTNVDDFQDHVETARFEGGREVLQKRTLRLSTVATIYDASTGSVKEVTSFQVENVETATGGSQFRTGDAGLSDRILTTMAREMSEKIANRVVDVIYPARVLSLSGQQVMLSRGDGTDVAVGQIWKVYALGEELVDFDTGEVLGQDEIEIGSVRVTQVLPRFSRAEVIENFGIERGQILRLVE